MNSWPTPSRTTWARSLPSFRIRAGGVEHGHAFAVGHLPEALGLQVVDPQMGRGLCVKRLERASRSVPAFFHAEKENAPSVRKEGGGLPGDLIGHVEIETSRAGSVAVHDVTATVAHKQESLDWRATLVFLRLGQVTARDRRGGRRSAQERLDEATAIEFGKFAMHVHGSMASDSGTGCQCLE